MKATKEQLLNFLCEQLDDCGTTDWFGYNQSIDDFRKEMSKKKQRDLQSIVFDLNEEGQKFLESFEN